MRSIGVDIGDYSVKIVELVQNKKNIQINQFQEKILSQNVSKEDKELEVIEFVRSFIAAGDHAKSRWALALRQDQATSRFKSFPFSDRLKIQKTLSFEMEEDIPFDTDNCVFDAKFIQTIGPAADVLASAVPKEHVESLMEMSANFGVEIYAISIEGLAFANLIENWDAPPPAAAANLNLNENDRPKKHIQIVLNIGHKKTLLTAFDNNRLVFTRALYWGANQLIQEIIKKNSITYVEAVKVLHSQGLLLLNKENASFDQTQLSSLIAKCIRELSRDIQMTLLELQSEFNADITAVHFTGGMSLLPNLGAFLTQQLEVACNPIQLLQNYAGSLNLAGSQLAQIEARFSVAVATAIEGFKKPRSPAVNLLKGDFARQSDFFKFVWTKYGRLVQVSTAAILVLFMWTSFRDNFSYTLDEKGREAVSAQAKAVARLPKKQANESGVRKYIKENKKKLTELKLVAQVAQMNSALDILKKVSESAPNKNQVKVDIRRFIVRDDTVQIIGYANNVQDVSTLSQSMKALATDAMVSNQPAGLSLMPNKTAFNISFKTNRGLAK